MVIQFVKLQSPLPDERVRAVMDERAPEFREVPGLVQKLYGREQGDTGAYCGIYAFDSQESLDAFRASEPARKIPSAYQAEMRVERLDLLSTLHPDKRLQATGAAADR